MDEEAETLKGKHLSRKEAAEGGLELGQPDSRTCVLPQEPIPILSPWLGPGVPEMLKCSPSQPLWQVQRGVYELELELELEIEQY